MSRGTLVPRMASAMERELRANAYKGDLWYLNPPALLSGDILYHAAKLDLAMRARDLEAVKELAADVANCAAILADAMGALDLDLGEIVEDLSYEEGAEVNGGMRYGSKELREKVTGWENELAWVETPNTVTERKAA